MHELRILRFWRLGPTLPRASRPARYRVISGVVLWYGREIRNLQENSATIRRADLSPNPGVRLAGPSDHHLLSQAFSDVELSARGSSMKSHVLKIKRRSPAALAATVNSKPFPLVGISTGVTRPYPGEKTVRPPSEFNNPAPAGEDSDD
jgi:hypothetical protein